jgi:hypothetical protein
MPLSESARLIRVSVVTGASGLEVPAESMVAEGWEQLLSSDPTSSDAMVREEKVGISVGKRGVKIRLLSLV